VYRSAFLALNFALILAVIIITPHGIGQYMQSFAERIREMGGWGMALLFVMVGTSRFLFFLNLFLNERTLTSRTESLFYVLWMESSPRITPTLIRIRILNDNDRLHVRVLAWSVVGCCG
jgi:hypothetical protein